MELWTMCIHCDKFRAINTSKNHILHFRTKHIGIRHSFIRDLVQDNVISLELVPTEHQLVDILIKPLDSLRFEYFRKSLGICLID